MNKELINEMIKEFEERRQVIDGCIQVLQIELMKENNKSPNKSPELHAGETTSETEETGSDTHIKQELNKEIEKDYLNAEVKKVTEKGKLRCVKSVKEVSK